MSDEEESQAVHFAVCLDNERATKPRSKPASRVIPGAEAAAHGYIRVMDESREDYVFLGERFHGGAGYAAGRHGQDPEQGGTNPAQLAHRRK